MVDVLWGTAIIVTGLLVVMYMISADCHDYKRKMEYYRGEYEKLLEEKAKAKP